MRPIEPAGLRSPRRAADSRPVHVENDRLRLAGGIAAASAILIGSLAWAYAALVELALIGADFCVESTCGDPDPAVAIGLAVPAAVGVMAMIALGVRVVAASARPDETRWRDVRRAAALAAAALGIWAGIIAVLAFA